MAATCEAADGGVQVVEDHVRWSDEVMKLLHWKSAELRLDQGRPEYASFADANEEKRLRMKIAPAPQEQGE